MRPINAVQPVRVYGINTGITCVSVGSIIGGSVTTGVSVGAKVADGISVGVNGASVTGGNVGSSVGFGVFVAGGNVTGTVTGTVAVTGGAGGFCQSVQIANAAQAASMIVIMLSKNLGKKERLRCLTFDLPGTTKRRLPGRWCVICEYSINCKRMQ